METTAYFPFNASVPNPDPMNRKPGASFLATERHSYFPETSPIAHKSSGGI